jgi:hypothetical protein
MVETLNKFNTYHLIITSPYDVLKKKCQMEKKKFVDDEFPPNSNSLNYTLSNRNVIWKRITEIVSNPLLFGQRMDPDSIQQGQLNDCYFLACISAIAELP